MELIIFNCPKCGQELEVDSSGAGEEIDCPSCNEAIVIPAENSPLVRRAVTPPAAPGAAGGVTEEPSKWGSQVVNAIASSAAAKVEKHLKVPIHDTPQAQLIAKPLKPLEVAAKEDNERQMKIKCIRHGDCVEVGHDRFDEMVCDFLGQVGEKHIISISPISYTTLDISTQKLMTDFGVMVVYRG